MKQVCVLVLSMLFASTAAYAVIIKSGVPDAKYLVPDSQFPALVDLPDEGHGVLIAKQWVVTVAHTVRSGAPKEVTIAGKPRAVVGLVVYPGFSSSASDYMKLMKEVKAGNVPVSSVMAQAASLRASMHDIALIKLAKAVNDVQPVALYRASDEHGKVAKLYGKGATGASAGGEYPDSPHRGKLRRAYNRISAAHKQWLVYNFSCGGDASPLEGVVGHGDSGGPLLIKKDGNWKLAGVAEGIYPQKNDIISLRRGAFKQGLCGQKFSSSRISYYAKWIGTVIANHKITPSE